MHERKVEVVVVTILGPAKGPDVRKTQSIGIEWDMFRGVKGHLAGVDDAVYFAIVFIEIQIGEFRLYGHLEHRYCAECG